LSSESNQPYQPYIPYGEPILDESPEPDENRREPSWFETKGTWILVGLIFTLLLGLKIAMDEEEGKRKVLPSGLAKYNIALNQKEKNDQARYERVINIAEPRYEKDALSAQVMVAAQVILKEKVAGSLLDTAEAPENSPLADAMTYIAGKKADEMIPASLSSELIPYGSIGDLMLKADKVSQRGVPAKIDSLGPVPKSMQAALQVALGLLLLVMIGSLIALPVLALNDPDALIFRAREHPFSDLNPDDTGGMMALKGTLILFLVMLSSVPFTLIPGLDGPLLTIVATTAGLVAMGAFLYFGGVLPKLSSRGALLPGIQIVVGFGVMIPMLIGAGILISVLGAVGFGAVGGTHPLAEEAARGGLLEFISAFLAAVVAAPILEEIIFRGYIFGGLRRSGMKPVGGGIATALMFGMIHPQNWAVVFGLAFIGWTMAMVVTWTRSIYTAMLVHACLNGMIVMMLYSGLPGTQ
jgi:membrane protease YdiL (CAAX protease family)